MYPTFNKFRNKLKLLRKAIINNNEQAVNELFDENLFLKDYLLKKVIIVIENKVASTYDLLPMKITDKVQHHFLNALYHFDIKEKALKKEVAAYFEKKAMQDQFTDDLKSIESLRSSSEYTAFSEDSASLGGSPDPAPEALDEEYVPSGKKKFQKTYTAFTRKSQTFFSGSAPSNQALLPSKVNLGNYHQKALIPFSVNQIKYNALNKLPTTNAEIDSCEKFLISFEQYKTMVSPNKPGLLISNKFYLERLLFCGGNPMVPGTDIRIQLTEEQIENNYDIAKQSDNKILMSLLSSYYSSVSHSTTGGTRIGF